MSPQISISASARLSGLATSVSVAHAARLLGVSPHTIHAGISGGILRTVPEAGGSPRVLLESLSQLGFRTQAFPTSAIAASFGLRPVAHF